MIKKVFLLGVFLSLSSCADFGAFGCIQPSPTVQAKAQLYYERWDTSIVKNITSEKGHEMFGCHYGAGDYVYVNKNLWSNVYILARHGKAVTFHEE